LLQQYMAVSSLVKFGGIVTNVLWASLRLELNHNMLVKKLLSPRYGIKVWSSDLLVAWVKEKRLHIGKT
jgi:hypothetical protein